MSHFPMGLLDEGCVLCDRVRAGASDSEYLGLLSECHVFESPLAKRWPGSLMLVYERHREEVSDIIANGVPPASVALLVAENAIRKVCAPRRMNVVKFGNVCAHLHWHLIPRYAGELCSEKTPWELVSSQESEVFSRELSNRLNSLNRVDLVKNLKEALKVASLPSGRFFYSAAIVVRPCDRLLRERVAHASAAEVVSLFRSDPAAWQALLMQRNYDDGGWDHFGGCSDGIEFPQETLVRELQEEAGWEAASMVECSRHWRGRSLRGFNFLVMPRDEQIFLNDEHPPVRGEVARAAWFSLHEIASESRFAGVVRDRMQALMCGNCDFDSEEVFVPSER